MKKTSVQSNFIMPTLPEVLWESTGVRYPFLCGFKLTRIRGELAQVDPNLFSQPQESLRFIRVGWRLKWHRPSCDLISSLYRLSNYCSANAYVRIWIRQGEKNLYRGYVVQVAWPTNWQDLTCLDEKEFTLSLWS